MFHVMWWAVIFVALKTSRCSEEKFYPDMLVLNNCFSFGIYMMVYMLHSRDYTLEWCDEEVVAKNLFVKQT